MNITELESAVLAETPVSPTDVLSAFRAASHEELWETAHRVTAHFKPRTYTSNGSEHTTNSVDRYYDFDPQAMQQDWVRDAEQAVMNGTAQQMPSQPQYSQQQMSWKNGGF